MNRLYWITYYNEYDFIMSEESNLPLSNGITQYITGIYHTIVQQDVEPIIGWHKALCHYYN